MKTATVAAVRDQFSEYLRLVESGETVTIFRRDKPVAEMRPVSPGARSSDHNEELFARLEREGVIRRGTGNWSAFEPPDPNAEPCGSVEALLRERHEGW